MHRELFIQSNWLNHSDSRCLRHHDDRSELSFDTREASLVYCYSASACHRSYRLVFGRAGQQTILTVDK